MLDRSRYQSIIWDWNGTLLDDVNLAVDVMNRLLSEYGYQPLTLELYTQVFDFPVRSYYEAIGFDLQRHNFESVSDRFCRDFEHGLTGSDLFTGTRSTLTRLNQQQHFVLSNTEQMALDRMLTSYALDHHFTSAYGQSNNHAAGKVGIGQDLISTHQLERARTVLIGDTTHDAEVADALGIDCVLVATGHNAKHRLEAMGVPVVDSLADLTQASLPGEQIQ